MKVRDIIEEGSLILHRDHVGRWWKIVEDCVRCGQCCMDVHPTWVWFDSDRGGCQYLEEEGVVYRCSLGKFGRPLRCCGNSPYSTVEYCSVRFEEIAEEDAVEVILKVS